MSCGQNIDCDIPVYRITEEILHKLQGKNNILFHGRYLKDGFSIFHGNENKIHELLVKTNNNHFQFFKTHLRDIRNHSNTVKNAFNEV